MKLALYIISALFLVFIVIIIGINAWFDRTHYDQSIYTYAQTTKMGTYVWHEGEIVKSWHDPIDSINNEGFINKRKMQAEKLVKQLSKL